MDKIFSVEFCWNGKMNLTKACCEHWPSNDQDASGLAYLAISTWFETQKSTMPEVVRNVNLVANGSGYHWDILPL